MRSRRVRDGRWERVVQFSLRDRDRLSKHVRWKEREVKREGGSLSPCTLSPWVGALWHPGNGDWRGSEGRALPLQAHGWSSCC